MKVKVCDETGAKIKIGNKYYARKVNEHYLVVKDERIGFKEAVNLGQSVEDDIFLTMLDSHNMYGMGAIPDDVIYIVKDGANMKYSMISQSNADIFESGESGGEMFLELKRIELQEFELKTAISVIKEMTEHEKEAVRQDKTSAGEMVIKYSSNTND
jgi:hypothetical protein